MRQVAAALADAPAAEAKGDAKKEEKKPEENAKSADEAMEGLSSLFG